MSKLKKIVVMEDDDILLKALNIELLSDSFDVISATNGEIGLLLSKKELPDLILLDLMMPKVNGFEVLASLKKNKKTKHIPVIILSNLGQDEEIKKCLALGALAYYKKSATDLVKLSSQIFKILSQ
ncbi:MAG: response regulator [Actinomycetota bacterium]